MTRSPSTAKVSIEDDTIDAIVTAEEKILFSLRLRRQSARESLLLAYGSPDGRDLSLDVPDLPLPGRPLVA
jgi:hypothetical protein